MMDNTPVPSRCSTTFALKIRFLKTTCSVSWTGTSASISFVRSCRTPTAIRADPRSIQNFCCATCRWVSLWCHQERKWLRSCKYLAWPARFTGLSFDQIFPITPRFLRTVMAVSPQSNLFQQLFEQIVDRCREAGLVEGEHLSVDGSFIPANASRLSRIPREQLAEAAHVKQTVREYLADLEQENPIEEPAPQQDQVSTTDPDSTDLDEGDRPAELGTSATIPSTTSSRDCGRSGNASPAEPGKCGGSRDDHAVSGKTRALSTVGCRRHDLWER